ncbi:zinc ribbon domain-containing protein [Chloroflexota bacterium]
MKCSYCQPENRESAEFCGDCGQSLKSENICSNCGNLNLQDKKFCDKCGQSLIEEAIRVCTEMQFRPDLDLSHLGLAELLLDQSPEEKDEALEHLDFAIKEFREMKMQPSLEMALRRKDILKA